MTILPLIAHLDTPCAFVRTFTVRADFNRGRLTLRYRVEGEMARLQIPVPKSPIRKDKLWQHTCFEAFVGVDHSQPYMEFNFSPTGEWAAYGFDTYREGMKAVELAQPPKITLDKAGEAVSMDVEVLLPSIAVPQHELKLGITAVLEDRDGGISYWALTHPPGKPDFHRPEGWTQPLSADSGEA